MPPRKERRDTMRKIILSIFLAIVLVGTFVWVGQRESRIEAQTLYRETRGVVLKYLEKISNPTDDVIQFESQGCLLYTSPSPRD